MSPFDPQRDRTNALLARIYWGLILIACGIYLLAGRTG